MKKFTLFFIALLVIGTVLSQEQKKANNLQTPRLIVDNETSQIKFSQQNSQRIESGLRVLGGGCNIGNEIDPGWGSGNFGSNFLLGVKFTLAEEGTLNSINLIGNDSGSEVQMAVYDDNGGSPNDLVVYSGVTAVGSGVVTLPVDPTILQAGDYWIMAIYASGGNHSNVNLDITGNVVYYTPLNFGDPIPVNAAGFISYTDQDFLYFLDITCGLGVEDNIKNLISIYPNPVKDRINIEMPSSIELINSALYNIIGNDTGLRIENQSLNTSNLDNGIYILTIETSLGSITKKVIKS